MREILESRKNKKITNKAYLEQHLLNLNQEQLKFKKDVQGRNKDNPSVAFELLIINCQTYFKVFSSFNCLALNFCPKRDTFCRQKRGPVTDARL